MKKSKFLAPAIMAILALSIVFSCKKSSSDSSGDIKVSLFVNVRSTAGEACGISSNVVIKLIKDGNTLATQTFTGNGNSNTVDFGNYAYGNYSVTGSASVVCVNTSTGTTSNGNDVSGSTSFAVNSTTNSVSLTVSN